jgi:hypothetical protein
MNAPYPHPPRGLSYYLKYLLILLICLSPSLVIIPLWVWDLDISPTAVAVLMGIVALLQFAIIAHPMLVSHTVVTDVGLPKDEDISYQMLPYPKTLSEATMLLEMEGFERFGEIETSTVMSKMPHPQWLYRSPKGHIIVGVLEIGDGTNAQAFLGFSTYSAKGNVTTTYPKGHQLRTGHSRYSGVNNSIEAAYAHHRKQVQEWIAEGNRPIAVQTVQEYIDLDCKNGPDNRVWIAQNLIDNILGFFLLFIALTPGFMLITSSFVPDVYGDIVSGDRSNIGFAMLVFGLSFCFLIGQRSKGIKVKGIKQKTKAKRKRS